MSRCIRHEQCPRCSGMGRDRSGDNLGVYGDGSTHCFSCGFRTGPTLRAKLERALTGAVDHEGINHVETKALLPSDAQTDVPATAWRWLLQYGLPYSYWQGRCCYSEKEGRLIFPIGKPTRFALGRKLEPVGTSKWKVYGDKSSYVEVIGQQLSTEVVLVEDLISAHKVAQVATAVPLFGTSVSDRVLKVLIDLGKPVALWLDNDQYSLLSKKIGRLQALTGLSVRHINTRKDPKAYSLDEIKEILK